MKKSAPWYVEQRAAALATVFLTRRTDVVVAAPQEESGLDLLVDLLKDGRPAKRTFGVMVEATTAPLSEKESGRLVTAALGRTRPRAGFPFPLCLLVFQVETGEGFYRWAARPAISKDGRPKLHTSGGAALRKLDAAALDEMVAEVDQWYDALLAALAV